MTTTEISSDQLIVVEHGAGRRYCQAHVPPATDGGESLSSVSEPRWRS